MRTFKIFLTWSALLMFLETGVQAGIGDSCGNTCCGCSSDRWFLFPQDETRLQINGWIDGGFIGNTSSPNSKFNGPYNAVDRSNEAMMNQLYLVTEMGLPASGIGLGGRFDILYGEDFFLAESIGMEKRQFMPDMFSAVEMDLFRQLRVAIDPKEISNRGKMFPDGEAPSLTQTGMHPLEEAGIISRE